MANDAISSPRGVAVRSRLKSPVRIIEKARQRAPRLCIVRSLLPGNAQTVTRCPGMAITRIRATREKAPCQDDGDR